MFWFALLLPLATTVQPPVNKPKIISKPRVPEGLNAGLTAQAIVSTDDDIKKKIFYGSQVKLGSVPFVVILLTNVGNNEVRSCGGSILSEYWIITAAHCVEDDDSCDECDSSSFLKIMHTNTITAGEKILYEQDGPEQKVFPKQIFVHPEYDSSALSNDIALIRLERPIVYNDFISNISIPSSLPDSSATVSVAGWGMTEKGDGYVLRKISYGIPTQSACRDRYPSELTESMWCSGDEEMKYRSGVGDSGGPIYHQVGDVFYLVGLVSWGPHRPISTGDYDVNTNVPFLHAWILNIQENYVAIELTVNENANILYWNNSATRYKHQPFTLTCKITDCKVQIQLTSIDFSKDDGTQLMIHNGGTLRSPHLAAINAYSGGPFLYTSTTSDLTLVIATGDKDKLVSFNASYKSVSKAGNTNGLCGPVGMLGNYKVCAEGQQCYHLSEQCDQYNDCPGYSDEHYCKYGDSPASDTAIGCYNSDFRCDNGYCVRKQFVCDAYDDCRDYSDEDDDACGGSSVGGTVYIVVLATFLHFVL